MSEVSYSRPWLLYLYAAYGVAIVAFPIAISATRLGAAASLPLFIFGAFIGLGVSVAYFWKAYSAPADMERGRKPRFVGPANQSPQFRVYDDFFVVREFEGLRFRTTVYSYDEALDVEYRRPFWQWPPFGGRLVVRLLDKQGERTIDVWSQQAKEIAAELAEAKRFAKKLELPLTTDAANPARRTPSAAFETGS